ncbi:MAG TPA: WD40 repeat domain-containing protein [Tepidisphaeraceae bacterium]|nr:WD40 repeat domain-containing protein [Tepidisphaeraceae bacterium]
MISTIETGENEVKTVVKYIAASRDQQRIATASDQVRLWNPTTGQLVAALGDYDAYDVQVATEYPGGLEFSEDGKTLLMLDRQGRVRLFDSITGLPLKVADLPTARLARASLSPNGKQIAIISKGTLGLYDSETGHQDKIIAETVSDRATSLRFSPNGKRIAYVDGSRVLIRDVETCEQILDYGLANSLAWSLNGEKLAVKSVYGIEILDASSGKPIHVRSGHQQPITFLSALPDISQFTSVDQAGWTITWNYRAGRFALAPLRSTRVNPVHFTASADDKTLLAQLGSRNFEARDTKTLELLPTTQPATVPALSTNSALSADLQFVAVETNRGNIDVWNRSTGDLIKSLEPAEPPNQTFGLSFSPDGKRLAVAYARTKNIGIWSLRDGSLLKMLQEDEPKQYSRLVWTSDGAALLAAGGTGISVFDLKIPGFRKRNELKNPTTLTTSPDGAFFAAISEGGIYVFESRSGGLVTKIDAPSVVDFTAIQFMGNSRVLAAGLASGEILIYDLGRLLVDPRLARTSLIQHWIMLGSEDAAQAFAAGAELIRYPNEFITGARGRIKQEDYRKWDILIEQLSSEDAATKEHAHRELETGGSGAARAVRVALLSPPTGEAGERLRSLDRLLNNSDDSPSPVRPNSRRPNLSPPPRDPRMPPLAISSLRAIQMLEWLGTADAKAVLSDLAKSNAWPEAASALARLEILARNTTTQPATTQSR